MKYLTFALTILLTGCAGAPVGWGGTNKVLFSNADTIMIEWDTLTSNEEAARNRALAHCGGRELTLIASDSRTLGLIPSRTWKCGATGSNQPTAMQGESGTDTKQAELYAKNQLCAATPRAQLTAKGPGFENYSVFCANGRWITVRCESGNCRALQ